MNVMQALSIVDTLRSGWYDSPYTYYMKKNKFLLESYSRSAIGEVELYLLEHKNKDPVSALEEFRKMVDNFACSAKTESAKNMFSTYYDISTDVLDVLLTKEKLFEDYRKRRE